MADGDQTLNLTLKLGPHALRHLREGAEKLGVSLEEYAAELIEQRLFDYDDYEWPNGRPDAATDDDVDPDAPTYSLEESMAVFREALERRLAAK